MQSAASMWTWIRSLTLNSLRLLTVNNQSCSESREQHLVGRFLLAVHYVANLPSIAKEKKTRLFFSAEGLQNFLFFSFFLPAQAFPQPQRIKCPSFSPTQPFTWPVKKHVQFVFSVTKKYIYRFAGYVYANHAMLMLQYLSSGSSVVKTRVFF